MYKFLSFLLLFFIPFSLLSQVLPKEGSKLNYRIIGFSFPSKYAGFCKLEIAAGYYNNSDSFRRNIVATQTSNTDRLVAEVPAFGKDYTWRIVHNKENGTLHHFSTMMSAKIDTASARLRIIKAAQRYKDAYVFIDCLQALFDMDGNPVWFLPDTTYMSNKIINSIDLKLTPSNTITYIIADKIKEVNYDGTVLWTGPNTGAVSGDTSEHYNHEFNKLENTHYMVMGSEDVAWTIPGYIPDTTRETDIIYDSNNIFRQKLKFSTIIEYDKSGSVIWSWKSSAYYKNSEMYKRKTDRGRYQQMDVHGNSFFFDEKSKVVYVSFRNTNQILKVKYPQGDVIAAYGTDSAGHALFSGQHSVKLSRDGEMYLFNNNSLHSAIPPQIVIVQEPKNTNDTLKKIWTYDCTLDGLTDLEKAYYSQKNERRRKKEEKDFIRARFTSGGNVIELPGGSIFTSLNGPSSKIFIVTRDKEEIWSAIPEEKQPVDGQWHAAPTYRASVIADRAQLEKVIWNAEIRSRDK